MKTSARTKKYKYARLIIILDWILCFGTAAVLILMAVGGVEPSESGVSMKEKVGTVLWGFGTSLVPVIVLSILVKDKIKPTVWMINVIIGNYLYANIGLYVVLILWFISNYIVVPLSKRFASKYLINKEIDFRG